MSSKAWKPKLIIIIITICCRATNNFAQLSSRNDGEKLKEVLLDTSRTGGRLKNGSPS
jgi:hypothetical protein